MAAAAEAAGAARGAAVADFLLLITLGLLFRMASYISSIVGTAWGAARSVVRGRPAESAAATGAGDKKKKGKKGKKGKPRTVPEYLSTFDIKRSDVEQVVAALKDMPEATKLELLKALWGVAAPPPTTAAPGAELAFVTPRAAKPSQAAAASADSSPTSVTMLPEDMASQTNPGPGFKNPDLSDEDGNDRSCSHGSGVGGSGAFDSGREETSTDDDRGSEEGYVTGHIAISPSVSSALPLSTPGILTKTNKAPLTPYLPPLLLLRANLHATDDPPWRFIGCTPCFLR